MNNVVKMPQAVRLSETQKIGYASLVQDVRDAHSILQRAQANVQNFLAAVVKEAGQDPAVGWTFNEDKMELVRKEDGDRDK